MSSDTRRMVAAVLVMLALTTACTADDDGARVGRSLPRVDWTNANVHWVTQPRTVGGRFVAYYERNDHLSVAGVDASTGQVVWEYAASVSLLTPGVAIALAHDDRQAYFGVPVGPNLSSRSVLVVAVDAASGTKVWTTDKSFVLVDFLDTCDGDATMLCASATTSGGRHEVRVDKATGHVTASPPDEPAARTGRALGAGLYDLGGRDPEVIAAIDPSGRTPGPGPRRALRRATGHLRLRLELGPLRRRPGRLLGLARSRSWLDDLSEQSMAAVDAATGDVLWVDDGAELGCGIAGYPALPRQEPIRCRRTGMATNDPDDPDDVPLVTGLNVAMERFDPATGATLWQTGLGPAISLVLDTAPLVRLSPTEFAIGRDDGSSVVVDIVTGETRQPTPDDVGWCVSANIYEDRQDPRDPDRRLGQDYLAQCRYDGSPVYVLTSSPIEAGARSGSTFAWVDAAGMHASTTGWVRW